MKVKWCKKLVVEIVTKFRTLEKETGAINIAQLKSENLIKREPYKYYTTLVKRRPLAQYSLSAYSTSFLHHW